MNAAATALDGDVDALKIDHNWIAALETPQGVRHVCARKTLAGQLRDDILEGRVHAHSEIDVHAKKADGTWLKETTKLGVLVPGDFELRVLYEPVWSHAMAGLKWGAVIGVGLKLLETAVTLAAVDSTLALLFLGALAVCFIPKVGRTGMLVIAVVASRISKVNFFFMVVGALLAGAVLGCLPGMAIGGFVGCVRRRRLPAARDAKREGRDLVWKAVVLPLAGAAAVWALYFGVVVPWLLRS